MNVMKKISLGETGFERKTKRTRKHVFLDEMNLVALIGPTRCHAQRQRRTPALCG